MQKRASDYRKGRVLFFLVKAMTFRENYTGRIMGQLRI